MFKISEAALLELIEEYESAGICSNCGHIVESGVEPDAHGYRCDSCGQRTVSGIETVLLAEAVH